MAQAWAKPITNLYGQAASYYHGHPAASRPHRITYEPVPDPSHSSSTPLQHASTSSYSKPSPSLTSHQRTHHNITSSLRTLIISSLIISTLLTAFLESCMIYLVYTWLSTRNVAASDGSRRSPWAAGSIVWPTYMLLGASAITFIVSLGLLIAACCRGRSTSTSASKKTVFSSTALNSIQVIIWIVVAVLYRVFQVERDLWGWACHEKAAAIQDVYVGIVDFGSLCRLQVCYFSLPRVFLPDSSE